MRTMVLLVVTAVLVSGAALASGPRSRRIPRTHWLPVDHSGFRRGCIQQIQSGPLHASDNGSAPLADAYGGPSAAERCGIRGSASCFERRFRAASLFLLYENRSRCVPKTASPDALETSP